MRRPLLHLGLLVVIVNLSAPSSGSDSWPQYRGPNGAGQSTGHVDVPWPEGGPTKIWDAETPNGFSSFSVAAGRAFTLISREIDGTDREVCVGLDAETGKEIWSVPFSACEYDHNGGDSGAQGNRGGDGPRSTPATDGERVFVYDSQMILACLDAETGDAKWQYDVKQEFNGKPVYWRNAISPVLDHDTLYISGGGAGESFLAFAKATGELRWKSGSEVATHATPVWANFGGQRQLVNLVRSGLLSLDPATGGELWRAKFNFRTSSAASPVISGNLVYCSAAYGVGAGLFEVAKANGEYSVSEIWTRPNRLMNHWSTPVVHEGHLYGLFGFKKYGRGPLQCVELQTGKVLWSQRGFGPGNVILVGDKLLVLADDGQLVVAETSSVEYRELARTTAVEGKCWSTPAYCNGRLYIRSTKEGVCLSVAAD